MTGPNGFEIQGSHLPVAPPVPQEILKALEQNAADEAISCLLPDRQQIQARYVAGVNGFEIQGSHLPVAPPVPQEILKKRLRENTPTPGYVRCWYQRFEIKVSHLPVAPPVPQEILKALEQYAADEARRVLDDGNTMCVASPNGFEIQESHLPVAPPLPQKILKALDQNAADGACGVVDYGQYSGQLAVDQIHCYLFWDLNKYSSHYVYCETIPIVYTQLQIVMVLLDSLSKSGYLLKGILALGPGSVKENGSSAETEYSHHRLATLLVSTGSKSRAAIWLWLLQAHR
ncbi:unnamed protein product [Phaedon cochleariae]|uniref:Uncharacterized protein n=1 Tax=Phaedon cochleariae TaxID=80249 RepID=A0A9N9X2N1_PHACE|nr:unnamed protein product [Phaedon cochleariae]